LSEKIITAIAMNPSPILSIVTPTRGDFSDEWCHELLKVRGEVEFLFVYHPYTSIREITDTRVRSLVSPYKGEMMQRHVGLLNARGTYLVALDDDDYIHPDIAQLVQEYFQRFPDSWILRLSKCNIDHQDRENIERPWEQLPDVNRLEILKKTPENPYPFQRGKFQGLLENPIAPIDTKFDFLHACFVKARNDHKGYHFENFNNIVWKTELVQKALPHLSEATKLWGHLTWIPVTGADRLTALFVQAKFYQKDRIIGHCLPKPEQIRYIYKEASLKPPRFHVFTDFLLLKQFPRYGYMWNLFLSKLYLVPRTFAKLLKWQLWQTDKQV
jgi:glycosyltransferase involved in cell wall biosynthesis